MVFTQLSIQEIRLLLRDEIQQALKEYSEKIRKEPDNDLLDIKQVAIKLKMAVPSIYGLVHRRQIPHIKRGKKLIFEKTQIEQWLQNGRQMTLGDSSKKSDEYLFHKNHLDP